MLVRSAGRRQRRHTSRILAASFAQLQLPWLAPAQLRWSASQTPSAAPSPSTPRRRSVSKSSRPRPQLRRLATAADQYTLRDDGAYPPPGYGTGFRNATQDKYVPWDLPPRTSSPVFPSDLQPRYHDPVKINTSTQAPSAVIRVQQGVSGNMKELLAHFHTSLSVGRRDRAAAIVQRLSEQCGPDAAELSYAHTAYLEDLFGSIQSHNESPDLSSQLFGEMQRWFETEVRKRDVRIDGRLLVLMVRAAIQGFYGFESSRDRSIRRYSELAHTLGQDTLDEVLFSAEYSDEEFTIVGRVTSDLFEGEEVPEQAADDSLLGLQSGHDAMKADSRKVLDPQDLPEVLPTEQKGLGLSSIKRVMEAFKDVPTLPSGATAEAQRDQALAKQRRLEETSVDVALERWRKADEDLRKLGISTSMQAKPVGALMWQWYEALLPALEKELEETRSTLNTEGHHETDRHFYGPYLELLPLSKVAANTILYTMTKMAQGKDQQTQKYENEVKVTALTMGIAKTLEQECQAVASIRKSDQNAASNNGTQIQRRHGTKNLPKWAAKSRNARTNKMKSSSQEIEANLEWPIAVKVKLGAMLISKLIESAHLPVTKEHPRTKEKVTRMQPAFLHRVKYHHGKKFGMVMTNPALTAKIQSEPVGSLIAKRMPMVVEPKRWSGWQSGGYLHYSNSILRLPVGDKSGKDYFLAADQKGDLEKVYGGLTVLGKVPWKVSPDVFQVQLEAWNSGEEIANLAPLYPEFEMPAEPDASAGPSRRRMWLSEVRDIENKKSGLHSKRCFQNFQLEVARSFVNETLYFPHSLDFRGRAYPIPPYLNHMGADNVRGLLTFANGKKLGPEGLRWLKIHLATVAGYDKASMEERVEYTMSHLDEIYDSVRSPLGGRRWWLKAEDAWQTLAACFELTKALDSPDPTEFVSYLPVQQDGTCNGLQHYAALGGDKIGAAQVNLEPGDRPADVYTAVAEAVKEEVRRDAKLGNEIAQKLDGHITRKCVKQPVMTNVYGVTFYGARMQVQKQLEVLFPDVKRSDAIGYGHMSQYIAKKIFKCLGTMFGGAQAIQTWLGRCADRISACMTPEQIDEYFNGLSKGPKKKGPGRKPKKAVTEGGLGEKDALRRAKPLFKSTVVWTTPLGLPVVQPYRASKARTISTGMQNLSLQEPQVWDPVSKRKQLQAFPPNFIHSLDASHMLLSALKCSELNVTFASIHDSFWTHACDVGTMSTVLRDAFVSMHSEDIIGRLREEFQVRYKGCMYLASVRSDSALGEQVKEMRRQLKQKKAQPDELTLEIERMRLVQSEDPAERARGEAMVTPGSVVASAEDDSAFALPSEMEGQTLGEIPEDTDDNNAATDMAMEADGDDLAAADSTYHSSEASGESGNDEAESVSKSTSKKPPVTKKLYVWVPMTFPKVPQKGDFDVTRLRESKYFFH